MATFKKVGLVATMGLAGVLLAGMTTHVFADGYKGEREGYGHHKGKMEMRDPAKMAQRLGQHLQLDEQTQAKVETLFAQTAAEQTALHEKRKAELSALLTPEQLEKFEAMQTRHGMKGKQEMKGKHDRDNKRADSPNMSTEAS